MYGNMWPTRGSSSSAKYGIASIVLCIGRKMHVRRSVAADHIKWGTNAESGTGASLEESCDGLSLTIAKWLPANSSRAERTVEINNFISNHERRGSRCKCRFLMNESWMRPIRVDLRENIFSWRR